MQLAELWEANNSQRATLMERLISALVAKGPLRDGLDTAIAVDIALALQPRDVSVPHETTWLEPQPMGTVDS